MSVQSILYTAFGSNIEVTEGGPDGILFNGHSTPHAALLEDPLYRSLDFADQMTIATSVLLYTTSLGEGGNTSPYPPIVSRGRMFIYHYEWYAPSDDYACSVFDANDGELIFDEWFSVLKEHGVMDHPTDVEGLAGFLLKHGHLIEGDWIRYEVPPEDGLDT